MFLEFKTELELVISVWNCWTKRHAPYPSFVLISYSVTGLTGKSVSPTILPPVSTVLLSCGSGCVTLTFMPFALHN